MKTSNRILSNRVAASESAGEASLATMADCLQRNEMPPPDLVQGFVKAVDAMLAGSDAELRRLALMQSLGLYRPEGNQREISSEPARLYWLLRLNDGLGKERAKDKVAEWLDVSTKTVETNVKRFPEWEGVTRGTLARRKRESEN